MKKETKEKKLAELAIDKLFKVGLHISPFRQEEANGKIDYDLGVSIKELQETIEQTKKRVTPTLPMLVYSSDITFFDGEDISAERLYFLNEDEYSEYLKIRQKIEKSALDENLLKKAEESYSSLLKMIKMIYEEERRNK